MSAMDRQLLARIGKVPAGEKLPLSAFARDLDATVSVVMSAIGGLVAAGKLDGKTLRPPVDGPVAGAPTSLGEQLFERIKAEGERRGLTVSQASQAIWSSNSSVFMLRKSPRPRQATIAKVEQWIQSPPADVGSEEAGALPAPVTTAPSATSAAKVGGGGARSNSAAPADRPTGAELVARIELEAFRRGITPAKLVEQGISMNAKTWLDQLREAKRPKPLTVERVEALIAGKPVPKGQRVTTAPEMLLPRADRAARGLPPSRRMEREEASLARTAGAREQVDVLRETTDAAHAQRRPGESLADAVKREAEEIAARRGAARKTGGGGLAKHESRTGETLADRIRRCGREVEAEEADTTTGLARKRDFPAIPADRWSKLAALAGEMGKRRSEVLIDVIDAGILCVTEDLREGER